MIVTHSALECFKSCRCKYKLRYMQCIVPRKQSDALTFGSATHEILEHYFTMLKSRVTDENRNDFDPFEYESFIDSISLLIHDIDSLNDIDKAKLRGLAIGYVNKWLKHDWEEYEVIDIEKEFNIDISQNIKFAGKIDGILKRISDGAYYILEHKTASAVDSSYVDQKAIDSQTLTYAIAIRDALGINVSGAIHDILIKQKIRIKNGESESAFRDRLVSSVTDDNFERIIIDFSPGRIEEFENELKISCEDLYGCRSYYKCTGSCIGRYGACEYLPLCTGSDVQTLAELYEEKRAHCEISESTLTEE